MSTLNETLQTLGKLWGKVLPNWPILVVSTSDHRNRITTRGSPAKRAGYDQQPGGRRRISVPSKVAVKIRLAVVQEFTSWYHQKGTLKNRTIALMQEPDSDTYVSNSGLSRSSSSITQTPAGTRALLTLTEADRRKTK